MKYTTRVSLTFDELISLTTAMEIRINEIERRIEENGDDEDRYWSKEKEKCMKMYDKFKKSLDRV